MINRESLNFAIVPQEAAEFDCPEAETAYDVWWLTLEKLATEDEVLVQAQLVKRLCQILKMAEDWS